MMILRSEWRAGRPRDSVIDGRPTLVDRQRNAAASGWSVAGQPVAHNSPPADAGPTSFGVGTVGHWSVAPGAGLIRGRGPTCVPAAHDSVNDLPEW